MTGFAVTRLTVLGLALAILTPGLAKADEHGEEPPAKQMEAPAQPPVDIRPKAETKAPAAVKAPFEIVRSLDALQDQIVQGNAAAQNALPHIIAQMGEKLMAADPQSWRQVKNARAVITYTLSGGQVRVIRHVIQLGNSPELEKKIMDGALAYVEGQEPKAKQLLMDINARSLPSSLGGHVALVQAMLISHDDPGKSYDLLDLARVLAPGTLVEETALRREVFNLSEGGNLNKYVLLSSQYLRRFQNSLYAENFKQRFSSTVIRFGMTGEPGQFNKIVNSISELEPNDQLHLFMLIAQTAILNGNVAIARVASEKAIEVAKEGSKDVPRAKLYEAAALILTNNYDQGIAKLKEVDVSRMPKHDAEFKAAILSIAKQIRQWPEMAGSEDDPEPKPNPLAPGRDATAAASAEPAIDLAQKAISDTDQLLQEHGH